MAPSRKTVGLDADLMESLKEVARKRGTGISPYLRRLVKEAIELEKLGHYAPRALREKRLEALLEMMNFAYVPVDEGLMRGSTDPREYGRRLGEMIREVGGDVYSLIEYLGLMHKIAIVQEDRITVFSMPRSDGPDVRITTAEILKGMAEGGRLRIRDSGSTAVIEMPEELREELRKRAEDEISRRRGRNLY